jgi:hypothetical protein
MALADWASQYGANVASWAESQTDQTQLGPIESVVVVASEAEEAVAASQGANDFGAMLEDVDWLMVFAGAGLALALYNAFKKKK